MTVKDIPVVDRALKREFKAHDAPIIELIEAQTHDPFRVLVGTILSARTKDVCTAGRWGGCSVWRWRILKLGQT